MCSPAKQALLATASDDDDDGDDDPADDAAPVHVARLHKRRVEFRVEFRVTRALYSMKHFGITYTTFAYNYWFICISLS